MDVVALGELLIDFATVSVDPDGYPTMAAHAGGAPANFLAALTKNGYHTALIGKVGTDAFGKMLTGTLRNAGIDTSGLVCDDRFFTTLAFVTFDSSGDRTFSFARKPGADTQLLFEELNLSLIDQTKIFHFGTLSLTDEPARTATQKAVAYAKRMGKLITYDPNLRKPLWRDMQECKEQLLWGLSQADVVKISDEEVDFLFGCSPDNGANILIDQYGVKLAMITLGPDGAYLKNKAASCRVSCPKVQCVDTTGAGDIFGGCAVSRLLALGKDPSLLTQQDLFFIGSFAATAASLSTQSPGGIPSIPTLSQVEQLLFQRNSPKAMTNF